MTSSWWQKANEAPPQTNEVYWFLAAGGVHGFLCVFASLRLCVRSTRHPVCDSRDAFVDQCHVEIDEQPQTLAGKAQMRQKLFLMNGSNDLNRLDFHDYKILHDQVRSESHFNPSALINNGNRLLSNHA